MNTPRNRQDSVDLDVRGQEFLENAKQQFERSVASLDAATLSQLNRRRQQALTETAAAAPVSRWVRWMPATGVAAATLIAVILLQGPAVNELPALEPAAQDFEILIGDDNLEMLEDLDFYSVLDTLAADSVG
jgi:hypothetical protein